MRCRIFFQAKYRFSTNILHPSAKGHIKFASTKHNNQHSNQLLPHNIISEIYKYTLKLGKLFHIHHKLSLFPASKLPARMAVVGFEPMSGTLNQRLRPLGHTTFSATALTSCHHFGLIKKLLFLRDDFQQYTGSIYNKYESIDRIFC